MDELILDEKRYVSSKRAAKITGYAKDYVGQLCREGRVPARLVGRSWYVLESAIQDHRFGASSAPKESSLTEEIKDSLAELTRNWESPRYEAVQAEEIPQVTKNEDNGIAGSVQRVEESLKDAWQSWLDQVSTGFSTPQEPEKTAVSEEKPAPKEEDFIAEKGVKVPIKAIYQPALTVPPARMRHAIEKEVDEVIEEVRQTHEKQKQGAGRAYISVLAGTLAVIALAVGVIGSGRFDKYIVSFKPASFIAGVAVYKINK